jgi:O-antigen ligase
MKVEIPVSIVPAAEGAVAVGVREARGEQSERVRPWRARPAAAAESSAVAPAIRWVFYAFVFSLPFETVNSGFLEPPTILGGLLLMATLLQPGRFLRWPPRAFWCFFIYLYLCFARAALEPAAYRPEVLHNIALLTQLTILSWIAFSLMRDERVARTALLVLAASCGTLSLLQVLGIAAEPTDIGAQAERVTTFGFHPNDLARILMLGLLAAVGLTYGGARSIVKPRFLVWPFVALVGIAIVQTGSRGGLLALAAGLMVFVLRGRGFITKVRNVFGVMLVMAFFVWAGFQFEGTRIRFEKTLEDGDLARREEIYPAAWQMFQERPLWGWGAVASTYELGGRLGHIDEDTKNPHNLILYGLVSTGLLGAIPLFLGIGLAYWAAWKSRRGPHGILPLAMITAVLVANMSGLWLFNKLHWLVMAYAVASIHYRRPAFLRGFAPLREKTKSLTPRRKAAKALSPSVSTTL